MQKESARPLPPKGKSNVRSIIPEDRASVQALSRALSLLEILAGDDDGYRLVDLAECSGLATSTVHRLLTTMQQKRFVSFESQSNLWHIGAQCFLVGSVFGRRRNMVELATPLMRHLRELEGETVTLGVIDQEELLILHQVESKEMVRAIRRPGSRSPLVNTAMGKAILASLPETRTTEVIQHGGLQRLTPRSITRGTTLHSALSAIRETGYAIDDEQTAVGLRCVAAAIFNEFAVPIAGLSIVGPSLRMTQGRLDSLGHRAFQTAKVVTELIGGRLPRQIAALA